MLKVVIKEGSAIARCFSQCVQYLVYSLVHCRQLSDKAVVEGLICHRKPLCCGVSMPKHRNTKGTIPSKSRARGALVVEFEDLHPPSISAICIVRSGA